MDVGGNNKTIKIQNQMLILKLIATYGGVSRIDLSKKTKLSKMTVSNLVSGLIDAGLVVEDANSIDTTGKLGRNPIALRIAPNSPCVCGIAIKRGRCVIVLGDLAGNIFEKEVLEILDTITEEQLVRFIEDGFFHLRNKTSRRIIGVGISCIGPIDSNSGVVLNPPFFHGIENVMLVQMVEKFSKLPAFLYNDGNAGALAELIYGSGRTISNFSYLHIMHGIGSGYALEGKVYNGNLGQSGEIGHSTINFSGPRCNCGNTGCLELYANITNVRKHITDSADFYSHSPLTKINKPTLLNVVDAANREDYLAISVLETYLGYVAHAMTNIISFLDLSHIIVDYSSTSEGTVLEDILYQKILSSAYHFKTKQIQMSRSQFRGDAPLIGAIALVASKVFENQIVL